MTDDGGAWVAGEDGWHSVNEDAAQAEKEAVRLIRKEMGKEECRDKYMGQITAIWDGKVKAAETARQKEYEKLQKETKEKNQENNKSVKSVKLPDMEMPELERAEPDKVVEIKSPDMIPEVNPVKKNASIEIPVKAETEETEADAEKNESRKEETPAELPMTVSPEKEKTELTAVKVKGNVQREEDAQKNEEGEITEQVEISIVSHPVVEIISKSDVT